MERVPVKSVLIASIGYDARTSSVEIEFCDGRIRRYFGVASSQYQRLMNASSKKDYYERYIERAEFPNVAIEARES